MKTTALLALLLAGPPLAAAGSPERACQAGRARTVYGMLVAQAACLRACWRDAADPAACRPPDGPGVAACLARTRARATAAVFGAACDRGCPACYDGCTAAVAASEVAYTSGLVATFAALVGCAPEATPAEARCRDGVARAAAWYGRARGRCFTRAHRRDGAGAAPAAGATATCTDAAARRAARVIDRRCAVARPACFGALDGRAWTGLVGDALDAGRPVIFCGGAA
jgi:hypothetical protein